jgi:type IV secretion system protein VirB9
MNLRPILPIAALVFAAGAAHADDARLLTRPYDPEAVVVVEGRAGVQATIAFADDEHIENVAIGDSTSWQVTPNKRANLLFVKPLGQRARTNMTVVTDRHMYVFELVAGGASTPAYVLRFTYPDEPKPATQAAAGPTADELDAAAAPPKDPADPASLNFAWSATGSRRLAPTRIYDDGVSTYLTWPARTSVPAILVRNDKGEEGPVNYAVRGEVVVVDSVPQTIVLRSGKDIATLEKGGQPAKAQAANPAVPSAGPALALAAQGQ